MLACMLWHDVQERWTVLRNAGEAPFPALQQAVDAVFEARIGDISGRGKLAADMREIWLMQPRFERRTPASATSLIAQVRFRAGYDFLRLRADCGEQPAELADWWEDFHLGNDEDREAMLRDLKPAAPSRARRAPTSAAAAELPDGAPSTSAADDADVDDGPPSSDAAAPRKRRRRRRKPGGGGAAGGAAGGAEGDANSAGGAPDGLPPRAD
jgi:poly(A) polymerase